MRHTQAVWRSTELKKLIDSFIQTYSGDSATETTRFEISQTLLHASQGDANRLKAPSIEQTQLFDAFKSAGIELWRGADIAARIAEQKVDTGSQMSLSSLESTRASRADNSAPPPAQTYIEIELLDENGAAVANEAYVIQDPEGNEYTGNTDGSGKARIDSIATGNCLVSFPTLKTEVSVSVPRVKIAALPAELARDFFEFKLIDGDDQPVADEAFILTDPQDNRYEGVTDTSGVARRRRCGWRM